MKAVDYKIMALKCEHPNDGERMVTGYLFFRSVELYFKRSWSLEFVHQLFKQSQIAPC